MKKWPPPPDSLTVPISVLIEKAKNFLEICSLPRGLSLKLQEPAFNRSDLAVCQRLLASGIRPTSIVDVGANIGQFALAASVTWPGIPITSYEPVPSAFEKLAALTRRQPAIQAHAKALGAACGNARLHVASAVESSSLLPLGPLHRKLYPHIKEEGLISVEVSTLAAEENLIASRSSPGPRLLKIDVQGYEKQVLAGAGLSLGNYRWILLETSTRPLYEGEAVFADLCSELDKSGFAFLSPVHIHISKSGAIGQFDALFEKTSPPHQTNLRPPIQVGETDDCA